MKLNNFNISSNISNDYFPNNFIPNDIELSNNDNSINDNCLESLGPNNFFSISDEDGLNGKNNNYGIKKIDKSVIKQKDIL